MRAIVVGAGEIGYNIAAQLAREKNDVVVLDRNEQRLQRVRETLDVQTFRGNGGSPELLRQAGLERAEIIIAVTDSDEVNVVACALAGAAAKGAVLVARVRDPDYHREKGLFQASGIHIDLVINPEREAAERILALLEMHGAVDAIPFADGRVLLLGAPVLASGPLGGRKLRDLGPDLVRGALVAAIEREGEVLVPSGEERLLPGDVAYLMTEPKRATDLLAALGHREVTDKLVVVFGGNNIGVAVAEGLEMMGYRPKLIEEDPDICAEVAGRLNKTVVLQGDATDEKLLREENVGEAAAIVCCSRSEEDNLLAGLLARQIGVKRVMLVTNRPGFLPLLGRIGVDVAVSPRRAAVGSILQFVRHGKVLSVVPLLEERAEAIEFAALETADIVGKPLLEAKLPAGAIVGAILRNDSVVIPRGTDRIQAGDRVLLFAMREVVKAVEKAFQVRLEYF